MKNEKLIKPSIVKSGLQVYYSPRGKSNNDKYREVLSNMSDPFTNDADIRNTTFTTDSGFDAQSALKFDGVDDYVRFTLDNLIMDRLTLEMTLKANNAIGCQTLVKVGAVPYAWWLRYNAGNVEFVIDDTVLLSTQVSLMKVTHVAVTLTKTSVQLLINGSKIGDIEIDIDDVYPLNSPIYIGTAYPNKYYFKGKLCSFRIYNDILTVDQLITNKNIDIGRWT